jgi:hypothetical protein
MLGVVRIGGNDKPRAPRLGGADVVGAQVQALRTGIDLQPNATPYGFIHHPLKIEWVGVAVQ